MVIYHVYTDIHYVGNLFNEEQYHHIRSANDRPAGQHQPPTLFLLLWGKQTGSASYCGSMVLRVLSRGSDLKSRFFTFPTYSVLFYISAIPPNTLPSHPIHNCASPSPRRQTNTGDGLIGPGAERAPANSSHLCAQCSGFWGEIVGNTSNTTIFLAPGPT